MQVVGARRASSVWSCGAGARAAALAVSDIETCCPWLSVAQTALACLGASGDFSAL